jgi:hypothetical protein
LSKIDELEKVESVKVEAFLKEVSAAIEKLKAEVTIQLN